MTFCLSYSSFAYSFFGSSVDLCDQKWDSRKGPAASGQLIVPVDVAEGRRSDLCTSHFIKQVDADINSELVADLLQLLEQSGNDWRSYKANVSGQSLLSQIRYDLPKLSTQQWQKLVRQRSYRHIGGANLSFIDTKGGARSEHSFAKLMGLWLCPYCTKDGGQQRGPQRAYLRPRDERMIRRLSQHWQVAIDAKHACTRRPYPFGFSDPRATFTSLSDGFSRLEPLQTFAIEEAHPKCRFDKLPADCAKAGFAVVDSFSPNLSAVGEKFALRSDGVVEWDCANTAKPSPACVAASMEYVAGVSRELQWRKGQTPKTDRAAESRSKTIADLEAQNQVNRLALHNIKRFPRCALQMGARDSLPPELGGDTKDIQPMSVSGEIRR